MDYISFFKPEIVGKRTRLLFPIAYGALIYFSIRLANDVISGSAFWLRPWQTTAEEILGGALISYLYAFTIWYLLQKNLARISGRPTFSQTTKEIFGVIFFLELISFGTLLPLAEFTDNGAQWYDVVYIGSIPLLYWLLYYTLFRGNALIKKSYEQQLQIEKISNDRLNTELQFLKAQFHPHFLFNALNTVYFQIEETNPTAKKTVEKLAELLRYQLYDQQEKVLLKQELEYLQAYIDFQKERSSEKLELVFNTEGACGELRIYPLLLIPLVENAFKYAGGDYQIHITAKISFKQLQFLVINSIPRLEVPFSKGGIGLENLKRRLNLLYPGKYEMENTKSGNMYRALLTISL